MFLITPNFEHKHGYEIFLLFLCYYAWQAHNFMNQMFLTSKYKSASMV